MEEESERRRAEERRSEKRKSEKKEDAGARKGGKVVGFSNDLWLRRVKKEDEKLHAVVAQSTFPSQNVQNTPTSDHFWKLRCRKSARRCGAIHIPKSKCRKHVSLGALLEVEMLKSVRRCGAKHISKSKCRKHVSLGPLLDVQMSFRMTGAGDSAPCQKWAKREGFVACPKTMAGHWQRICKDMQDAFHVAGAVQETCSSEMLGGQGADFLREVAFWGIRDPIFSFGKVILRDRCSTSYDLASLFRGRRNTLDRWNEKIAKRIGTKPSALHSPCHFRRKSRTTASFLMLSTWECEEVSQNRFFFDVVKFKKWGRLAELLCFWCCQVQKLRKSRRIASFSSLQIAARQIDR